MYWVVFAIKMGAPISVGRVRTIPQCVMRLMRLTAINSATQACQVCSVSGSCLYIMLQAGFGCHSAVGNTDLP